MMTSVLQSAIDPAARVLLAASDKGVNEVASAHSGSGSPAVAVIAIALISVGLLFFLGAVVGMVRFPDFYTRMHAAGKGDTLSSLLVILGFALYQLDAGAWDLTHWLVALKLLGICAFIMITSPTSTHALINAGYEDGCVPHTGDGVNALSKLPSSVVEKSHAKQVSDLDSHSRSDPGSSEI